MRQSYNLIKGGNGISVIPQGRGWAMEAGPYLRRDDGSLQKKGRKWRGKGHPEQSEGPAFFRAASWYPLPVMSFPLIGDQNDRQLEDIFAIQDDISLSILEALKVKLMVGKRKMYSDATPTIQMHISYICRGDSITINGWEPLVTLKP